VKLDNLVLVKNGRGYAMAEDQTKLTKTDYRFLQRFLDVTKANLFFARGVMIVEGDAENILLPVIAKLIGRDFEEYGVSVVNVGGVGLSRYGRIFMREKPEIDGEICLPIACVTDMDVMPDCAPAILGKIKEGEAIPPLAGSKRRWRVKSDFKGNELDEKRMRTRDKANEQCVRTFVADEWTLEHDLAYFGLAKQVHVAIALANADEKINERKVKNIDVGEAAKAAFEALEGKGLSKEEMCSHIYEPLAVSNPVSKPTTAQYLSELLERRIQTGKLTRESLRALLPPYVVQAIEHVTEPFAATGVSEQPETDEGEAVAAVTAEDGAIHA
jgi:putative ATP-dependent endonuclease of OLD family